MSRQLNLKESFANVKKRRRYSNEDIALSTLSSLPPVCSTTSSLPPVCSTTSSLPTVCSTTSSLPPVCSTTSLSTTGSLSTSLTSTSSFLSQSISSPTEPITPPIFQLQTTISVSSPSIDSELSIVTEHNCAPTVFENLSSNSLITTASSIDIYDPNDIGNFIDISVTKQDATRIYDVLKKPWTPPLFYKFPKVDHKGHSRSVCVSKWLIDFPWLSWIDKQSAIIIFRQLFGSILIVLEYLSIHGDSETSALSGAYHKSISSDIEFITSLIVVSRVFALTKPYTENLQSPTCDLVLCYDKIEELALYLTELLNDDNTDKLYDDLIQFSTQNDIPFVLSRRKKITPRAFFESIYQAFISSTIDELGPRFSTHQKLAIKISKLMPLHVKGVEFADMILGFSADL
ncbi:unnamed protein product [Rotaria sp. Silwood2]|nr:unnamed protein product [Rotaria sp. Silwood2]